MWAGDAAQGRALAHQAISPGFHPQHQIKRLQGWGGLERDRDMALKTQKSRSSYTLKVVVSFWKDLIRVSIFLTCQELDIHLGELWRVRQDRQMIGGCFLPSVLSLTDTKNRRPDKIQNTVTHCSRIERHSQTCSSRGLHHCTNITKCTYTNLRMLSITWQGFFHTQLHVPEC